MSERWPPVGAEPLVSFRVDGQPRPAGSKDTGVVTRFDPERGRRVPVMNPATGMPRTFTRDTSGPGGKNWRADVRQAVADALDAAHELVDGPLAVRITFFVSRPKGHYGSGKNAGVLKVGQPRYPHQSKLADGDKLSRALHDALTKLVWTDDSRVCECWWTRAYGRDGAQVDVYGLPLTVAASDSLSAEQLVIMAGNERCSDSTESDAEAPVAGESVDRAAVGDGAADRGDGGGGDAWDQAFQLFEGRAAASEAQDPGEGVCGGVL